MPEFSLFFRSRCAVWLVWCAALACAGHAVAGAAPEAEAELAEAFTEAANFSQARLDLIFLPADAPALGAFARFGLRFDPPPLPTPEPRQAPPAAPGSDPARPPILR